MNCIAHTWSSANCNGNHFFVCITPLSSTQGGAPVESFEEESTLVERLSELGLSHPAIEKNLSLLQGNARETWFHIEVPPETFAQFGRRAA